MKMAHAAWPPRSHQSKCATRRTHTAVTGGARKGYTEPQGLWACSFRQPMSPHQAHPVGTCSSHSEAGLLGQHHMAPLHGHGDLRARSLLHREPCSTQEGGTLSPARGPGCQEQGAGHAHNQGASSCRLPSSVRNDAVTHGTELPLLWAEVCREVSHWTRGVPLCLSGTGITNLRLHASRPGIRGTSRLRGTARHFWVKGTARIYSVPRVRRASQEATGVHSETQQSHRPQRERSHTRCVSRVWIPPQAQGARGDQAFLMRPLVFSFSPHPFSPHILGKRPPSNILDIQSFEL